MTVLAKCSAYDTWWWFSVVLAFSGIVISGHSSRDRTSSAFVRFRFQLAETSESPTSCPASALRHFSRRSLQLRAEALLCHRCCWSTMAISWSVSSSVMASSLSWLLAPCGSRMYLVRASICASRCRNSSITCYIQTISSVQLGLQNSCFTQCKLSNSKQESLANAKVSAQQPWYIGTNSLNHPALAKWSLVPYIRRPMSTNLGQPYLRP